MAKNIQDYEDEGFSVKVKPPIKTERKKKKPPVVVKVPAYDDRSLMSEVTKTNHVMHQAINQIAENMKKMEKVEKRPKKLVCQNIKRDTRGLMESFEVVVVE